MNDYFLNVNSNNIGGYLSSEQIDLLSIVQCKNIDELISFVNNCDQIKNIYSKLNLDELHNLDIENAKRNVFKAYQNSMVSHYANEDKSIENRLKSIGIRAEHFSRIKEALKNRNLVDIKQFVHENYGNQEDAILSLNHHFVSKERDQIKADNMYKEIEILNSKLPNFNTILVGSGKIYNVVNDFYTPDEPDKRFDFYKAKRDLDFAYNNGKQVRFHSLLVKEDANRLFDGKTKTEVLSILEGYVKASIDFVKEYNETHKIIIKGQEIPVINAIDLFNEIISFDKNEQGFYYNIWETKYGISMPELMHIFEYAKEHKGNDISYLYNEPFLENDERRKKVLETLKEIDSLSPGLIDTLGSQMHVTIGIPKENIRNCFEDLKKLQETTGKKVQITEFDMSLGNQEILRVFGTNSDVSLKQVYEYKKAKIDVISKIINESGINLSGVSYWSLTDGLDCNLERIRTNLLQQGLIADINQIPTACGGLIPTHQSLIKSINMDTDAKIR